MEYLQTPFEKIFSCGHICIRGDVYLEFGKKEERTFTIYGVKHFDDISAWMKDFMILSADEQWTADVILHKKKQEQKEKSFSLRS